MSSLPTTAPVRPAEIDRRMNDPATHATRSRPDPSSRRRMWQLIAVLSAFAMLASAYVMGRRISDFHKDNPREIFAFQELGINEFTFKGTPVKLTDEDQDGVWYLRLTHGSESIRLPVTIPGDRRLPGLVPHQQWMRVLLFSSAMGKTIDQVHADLVAGDADARLVVVTRSPRPGEPEAFAGRMNPKAWFFDFYEFIPGGGFEHQRLRFPTTKTKQPDKEGELRENTWQYQAALAVIPAGISPKPKFTNDGLKAAGWTLPATTGSMLLMIGAIVGASGSRRSPAIG